MPLSQGGGGGGVISGVGITGTAAAGQVPVASSASAGTWSYPPGFEVGYDQITAGVNITGTTAGTANAVITCAAHTFDGAAVLLTVYSPELAFTTAGLTGTIGVSLWESGAPIGDIAFMRVAQTTSQWFYSFVGMYRFTPTAASHTYTIAAYTSSTTGTPSFGAGAGGSGVLLPAFARFTKV